MNKQQPTIIQKLPSWENATLTVTTECGASYTVTPQHLGEMFEWFVENTMSEMSEMSTDITPEEFGAVFIRDLALHMISEEDRKAWQAKSPEEQEEFMRNVPDLIEQAKANIEAGNVIYE